MSLRRLIQSFENRSLRTKVTLGVALPLILILGLFTIIEYSRQRTALLKNLSLLASNAGEVIESNLRHEMLKSDFEGVQQLLDSVGANEQISVLYLLNTSGEVIFAPEGRNVGSILNNSQADCKPCHALPVDERPDSIVVTDVDGQRVFRSMQPIENDEACTECHDPDQRLIGLLLTDVPITSLETPLGAFLRENTLWWVGTILVTVLVVNLVLSRFLLNRLEKLAAAISGFSGGKYQPLNQESQSDEIGQLSKAFNTMAKNVISRNKENRTLSEHLRRQNAQRGLLLKRLITAQEDERKRVARELHDDLGQVFGGLALRLEALERLVSSNPDRALQQLRETKSLVADGTDRMYDLILALRPSALDDLGLVIAFRSLADRSLVDTGIELTFNADGMNGRLPPEIETNLYRIFQEALSNVVRHSEATQLYVTLACNDKAFSGVVLDNGRGFDLTTAQINGSDSQGLGLLGMEERVSQCGGQMEITSKLSQGTKITIFIPLIPDDYGQSNSSSDS